MNDMATDARLAPEPSEAEVRHSRAVSLVWLVPLLAALIAGWLAWTAYARQGPVVRLSFETADGLETGATRIKYREVDIGTVERIQIGDDLRRVVVTARMREGTERFATQGAQFWIVRPRVGTGGVSGLGTLVSGAYIEVDPGPGGESQEEFVGLEEPPQIRSNVPGRSFVLRADTLGSVTRGAPLYHRGIEVGQVLGYDLLEEGREGLRISVFVRAPYDALVRSQTRFWNASGVSVSTGADGFRLQLASVQSLLVGGINFETPADIGGEPAQPDAEFYLFPDSEAADRANHARGQPYLVEFEGSARGLRRHAPVEIRGIRIGSVDDVRLVSGAAPGTLHVQATIEIDPERIKVYDPATGEPEEARPTVEDYVGQGLRAQLKTGNLLTGDLYVDLDFYPDAAPAKLDTSTRLPTIPSVPTSLETIQASATELLQKFAALPLPDLINSLNGTAKNLEKLVGSEETSAAVAALGPTLSALRETLSGVNAQAEPLVGSLKGSAEAATATLRQAEATFGQLQRTLGPASPLGRDLEATMSELRNAARSIRVLTDYLERHPEALVRGRRGGYE